MARARSSGFIDFVAMTMLSPLVVCLRLHSGQALSSRRSRPSHGTSAEPYAGDHPGSWRNWTIATQIEHTRQIGQQERDAADNAVVAFKPHVAFLLFNQNCAA